jgi:C-terminal processing protease CtpA/Prc
VAPYISASTDRDLFKRSCRELLVGRAGTSVALTISDTAGQVRQVNLTRSSQVPPDLRPVPGPKLSKRDLGGGIVLVELSTFGDMSVAQEFNRAFPGFRGVRGLIIDLRKNGGGDTPIANKILARPIAVPVWGSSNWTARSYVPVYRAWRREETWIKGRGDVVFPAGLFGQYHGPLVLIVGEDTFSAAEDFVSALKKQDAQP